MKTKRKNLWLTTMLATLLITTIMGGCKKDDYVDIVGVCPLVVSTIPENLAVNRPTSQVITATFNEQMNPASINQESFIVEGTTAVTGVVTYSGTTATFTPSSALTPNTTYTCRIKTSVKDLIGLTLQEDYVWSFVTGPPFMVTSTSPLNKITKP